MRVIIQRSKESSVEIKGKIFNKIPFGYVILVSFTDGDNDDVIDYMIKKIVNLRIFEDENNIPNKSIIDVKGSILSISQFTLYANTKKGNRPSYNEALKREEASILYQKFNEKLSLYIPTLPGIFGEDMLLHIDNDGPFTIIMDSQEIMSR